jgi:hypothetical protein
MIGVLGLSNSKCTVRRVGTVRGQDGDPVPADTILVADAPCRLDQGSAARTYSNMLQGDIRSIQIVGRLYIDSTVTKDSGEPLDLQEKDKIYVDGRGPYQIFNLNRVQDMFSFHHYEIDLLDNVNR